MRTIEVELKARQDEPLSFNPSVTVALVATMLWRFVGLDIARKKPSTNSYFVSVVSKNSKNDSGV